MYTKVYKELMAQTLALEVIRSHCLPQTTLASPAALQSPAVVATVRRAHPALVRAVLVRTHSIHSLGLACRVSGPGRALSPAPACDRGPVARGPRRWLPFLPALLAGDCKLLTLFEQSNYM